MMGTLGTTCGGKHKHHLLHVIIIHRMQQKWSEESIYMYIYMHSIKYIYIYIYSLSIPLHGFDPYTRRALKLYKWHLRSTVNKEWRVMRPSIPCDYVTNVRQVLYFSIKKIINGLFN
jgi:hypothetical protein